MSDTQSISMSWDLPHAPAKVWRALTEPKLVAKWLMETDLQPEVGRAFKLTMPMPPDSWWDGIVHCVVQEVEPHKRLRYTWVSGTGNNKLDTVVTWTLSSTPSGTKLTLEQTGFTANNKFAFDGAKQGWQHNVATRMNALLGELT